MPKRRRRRFTVLGPVVLEVATDEAHDDLARVTQPAKLLHSV
jgi:hypothetical protein